MRFLPQTITSRTCRGPNAAVSPVRSRGFTLVEMLVTLALLLFLVVMWHGFGSRSNQQRQKKACEKNLQTIYVALEIFANEHEGQFPAVRDARTSEDALSLLVPRYTVASDNFICPGSKDSNIPSAAPLVKYRISYAYYMGLTMSATGAVLMSDRQIDNAPKAKGAAVFSTTGKAPGNNHHKFGGNFLQVDGEVRSSGPTLSEPLTWGKEVLLLNPRG